LLYQGRSNNIIRKIAYKIGRNIYDNTKVTTYGPDCYGYGTEIILNSVIKLGTILLVGTFLGIFKLTLVSMLVFIITRRVAGGVHSEYYSTCFGIGTVMLISIACLSRYIIWSKVMCVGLYSVSIVLSILITYMYVPGYTYKKSTDDPKALLKQKKETIIVIVGWSLLFVFFYMNNKLSMASVFPMSLLFEMLTVTPLGYIAVEGLDILSKRRCN